MVAERSVNTNSSSHVATFRPCKTAPPASYQSKNKASVNPASVSFKRRDCPNTLASNDQGALPVERAAHPVQPLHKKQKTFPVAMEAKSKTNANQCKPKSISKNSTTDAAKTSKEHDAITGTMMTYSKVLTWTSFKSPQKSTRSTCRRRSQLL